jgi:hypothetical protein
METQAGRVRALRCAGCGEVIGVYEPLVHVVDGIAHRTSRAADPQLAATQPDACYHLACSEAGGDEVISVG